MISQLHIRNFRSIKSADLPLGKITVLTGPNNSGKSSFIYALLALKNIVNNPNQSIDNFLTLPFINLGGFEQAVFNKNKGLDIELGTTIKYAEWEIEYYIELNPKTSTINLSFKSPNQQSYHIDVAFPYAANKYAQFNLLVDGEKRLLTWNGFTASIQEVAITFLHDLLPFQLPINTLSELDFVPIRRGFTKPYFGNVLYNLKYLPKKRSQRY